MRTDADFDAKMSKLKPTPAVTRACICAGLGGALTALAGLQLTGLVFRIALLKLAPYTLMSLGTLLVVVTARAYKLHELGARAALTLSVMLSVVNAAWFIVALRSGFVSMFGLLSPPLCLAASVLLRRALPDFKAAAHVRQELEDAGMDLGF